jgi:hypothetical protein
VHDLGLAPDAKVESTLLEHLQHWNILRQDFGNQFLEPGCPSNAGEMTHESCTDAAPLPFIHHGEGYLGPARREHDVTPAPDDHRSSIFFCRRNQCHVGDEVYVNAISDSVKSRLTAKKRR